MARPIKNTVDYFPHMVNHGKTIFILESKFGNDGYAFWFKLLELIGSSHNHVYDYGNPSDWEFLIAKTMVSEDKATEILKTLADVGAIDRDLWKQKKIWSDNFIKGIEDVYHKRKAETPAKPSFRHGNPSTTVVSDAETPQTKLKETKVNKSIKELANTPSNKSQNPEKKKASNIEYDWDNHYWIGIADDQLDTWQKKFPDLSVPMIINDAMIAEFKKKPKYYKQQAEGYYKGNYQFMIYDWLERRKKWKVEEELKKVNVKGMSHISEYMPSMKGG